MGERWRSDTAAARPADRSCRSCGTDDLVEVLDFGETPVADILLTEAQLDEPDPTFRLAVGVCPACALLQLTELIDPDVLYRGDYPYFSSTVPGLLQHFTDSADELIASRSIGPGHVVIEAASNDGYMLRRFAAAGARVLGVDPARGPAEAAEAAGVPTIVDYFTADLARALRDGGDRADLLLGNNVLNLVPDPNDFAEAVATLLSPTGEAVLEVPYAVDAVIGCEYDNFFHQNASYFSLTSLSALFDRHGLGVGDVRRVPTFGGSLRITLARDASPSPRARRLLDEERTSGVGTPAFYRDFATRARRSRDLLVDVLREQRALGRRTVAYGAAGGMATTLLSFAGIDRGVLDYAVDVNPHKHGLYTPGSRLEVFPPERLLDDRPDLVLLLAWNYADEILAANDEYRRGGGAFLVPIPEPHLVGPTLYVAS